MQEGGSTDQGLFVSPHSKAPNLPIWKGLKNNLKKITIQANKQNRAHYKSPSQGNTKWASTCKRCLQYWQCCRCWLSKFLVGENSLVGCCGSLGQDLKTLVLRSQQTDAQIQKDGGWKQFNRFWGSCCTPQRAGGENSLWLEWSLLMLTVPPMFMVERH